MYSYYCTFGEHRHPGHDFKSNIVNILRDTLEGILTNSEVYYREIQQQNRHPTRPQSIKESYVEFADVMIIKLKSYMTQCDLYHNQCLKGKVFYSLSKLNLYQQTKIHSIQKKKILIIDSNLNL